MAVYESICVWVTPSPRLDDATFMRHQPVYLHHTGRDYKFMWTAQLWVQDEASKGLGLVNLPTGQVPEEYDRQLQIIHVRHMRLLDKVATLQEQDLQHNDVLVLVKCEPHQVDYYLALFRAEQYPPKIEGIVDDVHRVDALDVSNCIDYSASVNSPNVREVDVLVLGVNADRSNFLTAIRCASSMTVGELVTEFWMRAQKTARTNVEAEHIPIKPVGDNLGAYSWVSLSRLSEGLCVSDMELPRIVIVFPTDEEMALRMLKDFYLEKEQVKPILYGWGIIASNPNTESQQTGSFKEDIEEEKKDITALIRNHKERLQILKERKAKYRESVEPSVLIEIREIEGKIKGLWTKLKNLVDITR